MMVLAGRWQDGSFLHLVQNRHLYTPWDTMPLEGSLWYPGSNRVKGACMAVRVEHYSDAGGLGSLEATILWLSWHISLAFEGWRRFKWESFYNYPHRVFAYLEVYARQYDIANISFLFCCLAIFYGLQLHFRASHVKSYYWNQKR